MDTHTGCELDALESSLSTVANEKRSVAQIDQNIHTMVMKIGSKGHFILTAGSDVGNEYC